MEIISQEYERMLRAEGSLCRKWSELEVEVGKVYTLMGTRKSDTKYGKSIILILNATTFARFHVTFLHQKLMHRTIL